MFGMFFLPFMLCLCTLAVKSENAYKFVVNPSARRRNELYFPCYYNLGKKNLKKKTGKYFFPI